MIKILKYMIYEKNISVNCGCGCGNLRPDEYRHGLHNGAHDYFNKGREVNL